MRARGGARAPALGGAALVLLVGSVVAAQGPAPAPGGARFDLALQDGLGVAGTSEKVRWAATVNGRVPGPTVYATEGETLEVDVRNEYASGSRASSVHWHGMYQRGTPFMDGVPGVSFCGILPGQSFQYKFTASPAGTHWYHSHSGGQYADGLAGALVVRPAPSAELPEWESSAGLEEQVLLAMEWAAAGAETEFAMLQFGENLRHAGSGAGRRRPGAAGRGGRGRAGTGPSTNETPGGGKPLMLADVAWPAWLLNGEPDGTAVFRLNPGTTTRFRFINGGANYCVVLRAEGLPMELVMTDPGQYVEPTPVDAIRAAIGERYDFLVAVPKDAEDRAYRLTLSDEAGNNTAVVGTVLVGDTEPPADVGNSFSDAALPGPAREVTNTYGFPQPWRGEPAPPRGRKVHLTLSGEENPYQWGIGNASLKEPTVPLMLSQGKFGYNESSMMLERVGVGEVVDFVFDNPTMMSHPFHLHGNDFWVLETWGALPGTNVTASDPPQRRDTVQVPAMGGARIRVRSENPGPWFMHCHIEFHLMAGMAMVVMVGDESEWPRVPPGTPVCGSAPEELQRLAGERPDLFGV